jgi:hypothetical protein
VSLPASISTRTTFYLPSAGGWVVAGQTVVLEDNEVATVLIPQSGANAGGQGFGVTPTTDGVSMTLTYTSPSQWGVSRTTGCPYFDSTAVTTGDEAVFTIGPNGALALIQF